MFLQHNEQMLGMSLVQVVLEISVGPGGRVRLCAVCVRVCVSVK